MLQGHVGNTSIKTAGYGTLHVRTVPASTLATTRLNMSERVMSADEQLWRTAELIAV